jgi:hypothetical protein
MRIDENTLTGPERALWAAFARGDRVDLRTGAADEDDPRDGSAWGPSRSVRGQVLASLLRGAQATTPAEPAAVRLVGARITGPFDVSGATVAVPLSLESCHVDQMPDFRDSRVRSVRFKRSVLPGFDGELMQVDGHLAFSYSTVNGRLRLVRARISGELLLWGVRLVNPGGWALFAGGLTVEGGLFGRVGPAATDNRAAIVDGGVRLVGARLHGGVFLDGAQLRNPGGQAFNGENMQVAGPLLCRRGFHAEGTVHLDRARVAGELSFAGAVLDAGAVALSLVGADTLQLDLRTARPVDGLVDLRHGHCAVLLDDPRTGPARQALDGFSYDALGRAGGVAPHPAASGEAPPGDAPPGTAPPGTAPPGTAPSGADLRARLDWLARDVDGYRPQPYEQLAGLYRRMGDDDDARRVLLARERRRRAARPLPGRILGHLLDALVGYGYRPWRAAAWLVAMLVVGTVTFALVPPVPDTGGTTRRLDPLVYTVDLLLPISAFGLRDDFVAVGGTRWLAYGLTAAGWLLVTALIAGVSRTVRRD